MSRPYDEYAEYDEYNRRRRPEERRPSRHSDGYGHRSPDRELRYQERYYDDRRYPPPAPRAYDSERRYDDRGYGHQHHEYHSPAFDRERYGRHDATPSRPQATPSRPPQAPQVGHPTPHQAYRGPRDNEKARLDGLERQKTVLKTAFPNRKSYPHPQDISPGTDEALFELCLSLPCTSKSRLYYGRTLFYDLHVFDTFHAWLVMAWLSLGLLLLILFNLQLQDIHEYMNTG